MSTVRFAEPARRDCLRALWPAGSGARSAATTSWSRFAAVPAALCATASGTTTTRAAVRPAAAIAPSAIVATFSAAGSAATSIAVPSAATSRGDNPLRQWPLGHAHPGTVGHANP
jgi:hypothetical protein